MIETLDASLLDAMARLVRLLDEPALVSRVAPLIQQEIHLLAGPHGPHLRHLVTVESPSQQTAKAGAWLKQNFVQAFDVDDLCAPCTHESHDV